MHDVWAPGAVNEGLYVPARQAVQTPGFPEQKVPAAHWIAPLPQVAPCACAAGSSSSRAHAMSDQRGVIGISLLLCAGVILRGKKEEHEGTKPRGNEREKL